MVCEEVIIRLSATNALPGLDTNLSIVPVEAYGEEYHRVISGLPQQPQVTPTTTPSSSKCSTNDVAACPRESSPTLDALDIRANFRASTEETTLTGSGSQLFVSGTAVNFGAFGTICHMEFFQSALKSSLEDVNPSHLEAMFPRRKHNTRFAAKC